MKYIPNRTKICPKCGKPILYNQKYVGIDILKGDGEIETEVQHYNLADCMPLQGDIGGFNPPSVSPSIMPLPYYVPNTAPYTAPSSTWQWNTSNASDGRAQA